MCYVFGYWHPAKMVWIWRNSVGKLNSSNWEMRKTKDGEDEKDYMF